MLSNYLLPVQAFGRVVRHYTSRLARLPKKSLWSCSYKNQVLSRAGEVDFPKAYYWQSHLPRIKGAATHSADVVINHYLNRRKVGFSQVETHWFRNAFIIDGSVFLEGYRRELRDSLKNKLPSFRFRSSIQEFDSAFLSSLECASTWWGHWLEDELPMEMLAEKFGNLVAIDRPKWRDEQLWRQICNLTEPVSCSTALVKNLIMVNEFAQNPSKTRRYHKIRERVISARASGAQRVYLRRGNTGVKRHLVNEPELIEVLSREGFQIADVSNGGQHVVDKLRSASLVVSVEGSHLAPALYLLNPGGSMVVLNPPYQVHTTVSDIGYFCGLDSGIFVCQPAAESRYEFVVDCSELLKFIDGLEHAQSQRRIMIERFVEEVLSLDTTVR